MAVGNIFIVLFLSYQFWYILSLFRKDIREEIQDRNERLEKLRKIPVKNIEEQKEFIKLKYPEKDKSKNIWKKIFHYIVRLVKIGITARALYYVFDLLSIDILLWQAMIIMIFLPVLLNLILRQFGVQNQKDITVFFR